MLNKVMREITFPILPNTIDEELKMYLMRIEEIIREIALGESFLDEDDMTSDSAIDGVSQQSVKAHVAAETLDLQTGKIVYSALTDEDDDSNAMLAAHAYLANQSGEVIVRFTATDPFDVIGYVDTDSNPASGGTVAGRIKVQTWLEEDDIHSFSFAVAKNEYFEITASGTSSLSILWRGTGTLSKPTDQD